MTRTNCASTRTALRFLAVALAFLLAGQGATAQEHTRTLHGAATLSPMTLQLPDSTTRPYEIGHLTVPQNRTRAQTDSLGLEFFRFPKDAEAPAGVPPIFLLRGGPGSDTMGPLLERDWYFPELLAPYTSIADLIVPGQRGFFTSGATPCEDRRALTVEEALSDEVYRQVTREAVEACRLKWENEGVDLSGYNLVEMAHDLIDIADALGYDEIQLAGVSFGSQWGIATLRLHPSRIARATFGGLEGLDHALDRPAHVYAALERIAASAEASPALKDQIPPEGLLRAYAEVIRHADAEPVTVQTVHPETDDSVFVTIDGDAFRRSIQGYTRGTRWRFAMPAWPRDLMRVIEGEYEGVARRWLRSRMNPGLDDAAFYAIECASGISDARRAVYAADEEAKLLGSALAFNELVCENRLGDMGDELRAPFTSDVPVVMIQGDWDTSTPYENALELAGYFTGHHLVTVAGGSHGAQREANEEVPGFRDEVLRWMRTGSYEHLSGRVELKPVLWE